MVGEGVARMSKWSGMTFKRRRYEGEKDPVGLGLI